MTLYLLSVMGTAGDPAPSAEETDRMYAAVGTFNKKIQGSGAWVFAGGLHGIENATVVDGTGTETIVTDGPYSEAKEFLGGFWVVRAPDLDAALELAAEGSAACGAKVEVRPFQDDTEA